MRAEPAVAAYRASAGVIRNSRTAYALQDAAGGVVAEFVDDRVTATDVRRGVETSWREWELELGPAAPADLAGRAALFAAADARVTAAKTDVNNLMQALKLYKLDNQRFPTGEQGLNALVAQPTTGPIPPNWRRYLDKLPADPWNRPYQYLNPGLHGEVDVLSLGADGQAGGEGKDADIGSWQ